MSYLEDTKYKEYADALQKQLSDFRQEVQANADSKVLSSKASALWEKVQASYHSLTVYLKETFNVQVDNAAENKVKELVHKAKELWYEIKADFLKAKDKS